MTYEMLGHVDYPGMYQLSVSCTSAIPALVDSNEYTTEQKLG